ncbi:Aminoacyl-tRNA editing domain-containing protein, partial [Streptomyces sp. Ncost-T6T-2b]
STPEPAETAPVSPAHPRFAEALAELGLQVEVRRFPDATRTAAEAAAAIGCELSEIVKSLVFTADGVPVLVLMDGASRVDVELVRRELGAQKVARANADLVRETTGYAIGGVPPSATPQRPASWPTAASWTTRWCGRRRAPRTRCSRSTRKR